MTSSAETRASQLVKAASITAVFTIVANLITVGANVYTAKITQDRQTATEVSNKFDAAANQIVEAVGSFIVALNEKGDLSTPKKKIQDITATQVVELDHLRKRAPKASSIAAYQDALMRFNETAQKLDSPADIGPWSQAFELVMKARQSVSAELEKARG
jgi:hypothetical protein